MMTKDDLKSTDESCDLPLMTSLQRTFKSGISLELSSAGLGRNTLKMEWQASAETNFTLTQAQCLLCLKKTLEDALKEVEAKLEQVRSEP